MEKGDEEAGLPGDGQDVHRMHGKYFWISFYCWEKKGLFSLSELPFLFWVKEGLYNLVINSGLMKPNRDYRVFFLKQHLFQIKRARELHWLWIGMKPEIIPPFPQMSFTSFTTTNQ